MATEETHRTIAPVVGPDDERVFTDSGIEIERLYDAEDVAPGLEERLGEPGAPPFTRGIHDGMYRDRLWTMRQYAGYATAEETNTRYRYLIEHGLAIGGAILLAGMITGGIIVGTWIGRGFGELS